jgi:predicted GH43/DUF377 family glycosyl hydrolase
VPGGDCTYCGGSSDKASVLTFASMLADGTFSPVSAASVVFGPSDASDSWGTEDPRIAYNAADGLYYMFYTAYNGSAIFLSLATSPNPTAAGGGWKRLGAVFPSQPGSKSAALLLAAAGSGSPHHLYWGDSSIRVATSPDPSRWPNPGEVLLAPRPDAFDSLLVEAGPPPLRLSTGDVLFFYNSASLGWPAVGSAYHVGWCVLDGDDPTRVKQRSSEPLLSPAFAFENGTALYACNAPDVVFLEGATPLGGDAFRVFFGGADAVVGSAVIQVSAIAL